MPFPFARVMREKFNLCSVVTASQGPRLQNLDGHWTIDVSGSYGVNVAGFDRYKEWIGKGWERVKDLGPVLGPLHPIVADNIAALKTISHMDEVSFHMSGTEAVMAAVRMARFNTRRKLIVCFSGAYHGWWDGVQPGLGSERPVDDCLTLKDLNPASLAVIRRRAQGNRRRAGQSGAVVSSQLAAAQRCGAAHQRSAQNPGLHRALCPVAAPTARPVQRLRHSADLRRSLLPAFASRPGGAQEYFGVRADMVVYGKTVAGGMPIGVVCGKKTLMRRFDPESPMRIAYVVGTFSAHPAVMGAMNEFLRWVVEPQRRNSMRNRISAAPSGCKRPIKNSPTPRCRLRVVNLATVWTVLFKEPSRYNWLLQYYLRAEGVTLSWVGTGRCLSSMDFTA